MPKTPQLKIVRIGGRRSSERDQRRRGRVDERRRRPAEQHQGGDGEDEAERDPVRVGALDGNGVALGERRRDQEREDTGDLGRRMGPRDEHERRRDVRADAHDRDRHDDREKLRGWQRPVSPTSS